MLFAMLALACSASAPAADFTIGAPNPLANNLPVKLPASGELVITSTGGTQSFTVSGSNLSEDIRLTASAGFKVAPATLPANVENATVRVTYASTLPETDGILVMRSGDFRQVISLKGYGTPLAVKDLSAEPVHTGNDSKFSHTTADGFTAGENGFTVEFRVKLAKPTDEFKAYGVTSEGGAFQAYVFPEEMGLYNSTSRVAFNNPLTDVDGGNHKFYNRDGKFHTYRYAVTSDKRVFVYRDGIEVACLRTSDFGNQADWATADTEILENLLKNPGFEGEWNTRADGLVDKVEGWIVDPIDRYNCTYEVNNYEINNDLDQYNHVLKLQRYNWNDGWGAGTVSQVVDVAPNSTYSLSFLAGGGMDKKSGTNMSSVKIQEVQDTRNGASVTVTNEEGMQPYGLNYTTSADCKQIKVIVHNERFLNGGGWGSNPVAFRVDEMQLTGMGRQLDQLVGYAKGGAQVEYFTYDPTGAFAPANPVITPETNYIELDGTGSARTIKIDVADLLSADPITVSATAGFSVYPAKLDPAKGGQIRVTLNSTLSETTGKVILRSGDLRTYIDLVGYGSALEEKDIKANPVYAGGKDTYLSNGIADGFAPGKDGYTVEFRVKIDKNSSFDAFAVTEQDAAFKAYVEPEAMGLYNAASKVGFENPATAEDGGKKQFYNNDGKFHTYRYAVTSDKRVVIYRDGLEVARLRTSDYGHQPEWAVGDTEITENLLKNSGFEGEWNARTTDSLTNKIEGWIVDPIDRYNCTYEINNYEIDNTLDHNNHVLKLQRYNWNDGWGAGTVSQIVDVAPNSTYSLSFLAGGGMDTKSGTNMSSVKIQEVQSDRNGASVTITNENGMQPYGLNYTTSADCKQIKVVVHNERFLNGGGWGSSPVAFRVDEMQLTGMGRQLDQLVGFSNAGSNIEYFTYDTTGAFAPLAPGFGSDLETGVAELQAADAAYVRTLADGIAIYNLPVDARVTLYDATGKLVAALPGYLSGDAISLPLRGLYIIAVEAPSGNQTLKVMY